MWVELSPDEQEAAERLWPAPMWGHDELSTMEQLWDDYSASVYCTRYLDLAPDAAL